jgi:hypothetical protein
MKVFAKDGSVAVLPLVFCVLLSVLCPASSKIFKYFKDKHNKKPSKAPSQIAKPPSNPVVVNVNPSPVSGSENAANLSGVESLIVPSPEDEIFIGSVLSHRKNRTEQNKPFRDDGLMDKKGVVIVNLRATIPNDTVYGFVGGASSLSSEVRPGVESVNDHEFGESEPAKKKTPGQNEVSVDSQLIATFLALPRTHILISML